LLFPRIGASVQSLAPLGSAPHTMHEAEDAPEENMFLTMADTPGAPITGMDDPHLLVCPRCHAQLMQNGERLTCSSAHCGLASEAFATHGGTPVLIDFEQSIVDRRKFLADGGGDDMERHALSSPRAYRWVKRLTGANRCAARNAELFIALLKLRRARPIVVIVGGGTRGIGSDRLWTDPQIKLISFDIYDSPNVQFLADAHAMPLPDGSVDGVWVQAVLEHVLGPAQVVSEIHRVLGPEGLVYAETPFMQQVHEFQYDFFRVSHSAHRWLFRGFDELASGAVGGAGTALNWSIKYLVWCLTGSQTASRVTSLCFAWLRLLDGLGSRRRRLDSACGLYFLGRRSETAIAPRDMISYYDSQ
jgi:SAM-dependent methyltransferase